MTNTIRDVYLFYFKAMYANAHKKRLYWMYYTLFFGLLPLAIRVIASVFAPESQITIVVIGDVVFCGIMFNAAALYNISVAENVPDVQVSAVASAFVRATILVAIYTLALIPAINQSILLLVPAVILSLFSLYASYRMTDSTFLWKKQKIYNLANRIEEHPEPLRHMLRKTLHQCLKDEGKIDIDAAVDKCLEKCRQEMNNEARPSPDAF